MESLLQVGLVIGGVPMIDGPIGQKGFCAAGVDNLHHHLQC